MLTYVYSNRIRSASGIHRLVCRCLATAPAWSIYGEDHRELQRTVQKVIDKDINPFVDQWESEKSFPAKELFKKLGNAGLLGVTKPKEWGGSGLDFSYSVALNEQLGNVHCGGVPMAIAVQTDMSTPALAKYGNDRIKREFLAPSISGDLVSCLGVSEPGAGSDVSSIQTRAVRKGDDLVISGQKMWITSGCQADWVCLLANTSQGATHRNKSLICVPTDTKGFTVAKRIEKIGMHSSDTAQIFLEDVRVPAEYIIGEAGMGFSYQMEQFQQERLAGIALALAPLETCIRQTVEYTGQRVAFGQPLLHNQYLHFTLAELKTEVELLRSLLHRAVASYIGGSDVTELASMGKLKAGRLCREIPDKCLQFWGGMGFTNDVLVSRVYRDLRLVSIGAGADEVMLNIICKYMGTLPAPVK